mmetsp:Transcript_11734/g.43738  ORF Transcript_11734/g.43738 Transcript_11734/m.43738 type:complete len:89 (+) Transcript_11734:1568-1834(+)
MLPGLQYDAERPRISKVKQSQELRKCGDCMFNDYARFRALLQQAVNSVRSSASYTTAPTIFLEDADFDKFQDAIVITVLGAQTEQSVW